jgi:hypothetical protein
MVPKSASLMPCWSSARHAAGGTAGGRQRTDSTHILAAVRRLNRLECVGEALFHALNILAQVAPEWVRAHAKPIWAERYGHRVEDYRLPKGKEDRRRYAEEIGADGWELLALVEAPDAPTWLRDLPAVETRAAYLVSAVLRARSRRALAHR